MMSEITAISILDLAFTHLVEAGNGRGGTLDKLEKAMREISGLTGCWLIPKKPIWLEMVQGQNDENKKTCPQNLQVGGRSTTRRKRKEKKIPIGLGG